MAGLINMSLLASWLTYVAAGMELAPTFSVGPEVPELDFPEILGIVTRSPGGASEMEGVVRLCTFQVRIRMLRDYYAQGDAIADAVDLALMFGAWPASVWGTRILSVGQTGSGPSPVVEDALAGRLVFTCNYYAKEILQIGAPSR